MIRHIESLTEIKENQNSDHTRVNVGLYITSDLQQSSLGDKSLGYKRSGPKTALRYTDIAFTVIYYPRTDGGKDFKKVKKTHKIHVIISVPDNYILGIYNHNYQYRGLCAIYNAWLHRVTMPPGDVEAELMLKEEEVYSRDFRQLQANLMTRH